MIIYVNDKEILTQATSLQNLAHELNLPEQGIAVAVDNKLIPRSEWSAFNLNERMSVVVIQAACGG